MLVGAMWTTISCLMTAYRCFPVRKHCRRMLWALGVLEKILLRWRMSADSMDANLLADLTMENPAQNQQHHDIVYPPLFEMEKDEVESVGNAGEGTGENEVEEDEVEVAVGFGGEGMGEGEKTPGGESGNKETTGVATEILLEDSLQTKGMAKGMRLENAGKRKRIEKIPREERGNKKRNGFRSGISLEDILQNEGMSLKDASNNLNVSRSTLKRCCRENGIDRWPPCKKQKLINQSCPDESPTFVDQERITQLNSDVLLTSSQVSTTIGINNKTNGKIWRSKNKVSVVVAVENGRAGTASGKEAATRGWNLLHQIQR